MCEKCRELVACPIGEKRIVTVAPATVPETVDYYGRTLYTGRSEEHTSELQSL